jgi:hypothetical protein
MSARRLVAWRAGRWVLFGGVLVAACQMKGQKGAPGAVGTVAECDTVHFDPDTTHWAPVRSFGQGARLKVVPALYLPQGHPDSAGRFIAKIVNSDSQFAYQPFKVPKGPSASCIWVAQKGADTTQYDGAFVSTDGTSRLFTVAWTDHDSVHTHSQAHWRDEQGKVVDYDSTALGNIGPWSTCSTNGCCKPQ